MSAALDLGQLNSPLAQQIEILYQGVWYPFPLVPQSLISRQPMNPFSPAVQRGNAQEVLDQRMNVVVWDDFTGGMGERRQDPNKGLTNFYTSGLNTRRAGAVTLPTASSAYCALASTVPAPAHIEYLPDLGGGHQGVLIWTETANKAWTNDNTAGGGGAAVTTIAGATDVIRAFARFNGRYYLSFLTAGVAHCKWSTDGVTWNNVTGDPPLTGLCVHDNALFSFNNTDKRLYKSTDGLTFTAYSSAVGAAGSGVVTFETGEVFRQICPWTLPSGQGETIYLLTNRRVIVLEEETGYWHDYFTDFPVDGTYAWMHPWRRTQLLYVTFYHPTNPDQSIVLVNSGGTTDEVGPRKKGYLPENWLHSIGFVQGNIHELFACGTGGSYGGVYSPGSIMSMNEQGGWHTVVDGRVAVGNPDFIAGFGYYGGNLYWVQSNGFVYRLPNPDLVETLPRTSTTYYPWNFTYSLNSSETDGGLRNVWKIGAYFLVNTYKADGSPGIPANTQMQLWVRADGGAWQALPLLTSGSTWPAIQVLPAGVAQTGLPFKRLQWQLDMKATAFGTTTPALDSIALYYTLWLEQFYSYQYNIDFRDETWHPWGESGFQGYNREFLQALLETISQQKGYTQFRLGAGPWAKTLVATDMLLTHRLTPGNNGAITTVSLRDLTAPTS